MIRRYPQTISLDGHSYEVEKILKEDFYSVNVLYRSAETSRRYVLKLSGFRFIFGQILQPWSGLMNWREYQIYKNLVDIEGVPALGPRLGWNGYFHEYVEGKTLFEIKKESGVVPDSLFVDLRRIIDTLHSRRIFYVDLNKLGNIIVGDDGKTYLIDYQISLPFPKSGVLAALTKPIFALLAQDDIYHLYKHKSYFQPEKMSEEEKQLAKKSQLKLIFDNLLWKNFRRIKRAFYPHGSNEIIWYKWNKMQKDGSASTMEMP